MDLSVVQTFEDGRTQVRSLCIWNGSVLDYVKDVDAKKFKTFVERRLKKDRAVLAVAVVMLYFKLKSKQ